jgi:cobalt/nickel transport system ATP-binding protein
MTFTLTPTLTIVLSLAATAGVLYFMWSKLRGRLNGVQYVVIGLTVPTAAIHMLSGATAYLLYLNGVGYLVLLLLLYFAPLGPLELYRRWLYGILAIYTVITIVGYVVAHPWGVHGDSLDTLGIFTKAVEVALLIALGVDYMRGGQPVTPLIGKSVAPVLAAAQSQSQRVPNGGPALEVHELTYSYPDKPNVLQNINLTIQPKERVGLIGPNGAGKTTLFLSLVGIQRPEAGETSLFGQPLKHRDFRPEIGMVFQKSDDQLFSPSVRDDVAFGPDNLGLSTEEIEERVEEALATTGTTKLADRPPHHLSGGEKRMVSIAGVMAMRPRLVIYDEPSANLDMRARRRLIEFLRQAEHAFIIASHDLEFLLEVCHRIILLDGGRIIADGPPHEVMSNATLMEAHGLERPHSLTPHAEPILA